MTGRDRWVNDQKTMATTATIRSGASAWLREMDTILAARQMETATGDEIAVIAGLYREMYKLRSILVPSTDAVFRARITAWMTDANAAFSAVAIRPETAHLIAAIYRGMFRLRTALTATAAIAPTPTPSPSPVPASSPAPPAARAAPPPAARAAATPALVPSRAATDKASRQLKAQRMSLRTFGYSMDTPASRRQTAIRLAIRQHGAKLVQTRLELLTELWADSRKPAYLAVLKEDSAFVREYAAAAGAPIDSDDSD